MNVEPNTLSFQQKCYFQPGKMNFILEGGILNETVEFSMKKI